MRQSSSDIAFTPAVKAIQSDKGSRSSYARMETSGSWETEVTPELEAFLADLHDEEIAGRAAHTLKGTLQIFGVLPLVTLVSQIESMVEANDWNALTPLITQLKTKLESLVAAMLVFQQSNSETQRTVTRMQCADLTEVR